MRCRLDHAEEVQELMQVLPPFLREIRPTGSAWTCSRVTHLSSIGKVHIFHLDTRRLILRVWLIPGAIYYNLQPKHGTAKDYVIRNFDPTNIYKITEKSIFSEEEWAKLSKN